MIKYTRHSLKKLEELFKELEYTIRYEKGNFNSGYCIVENRKIAIINKFYDVEGRINVLLEILTSLRAELEVSLLTESSQKFYRRIEFHADEEE